MESRKVRIVLVVELDAVGPLPCPAASVATALVKELKGLPPHGKTVWVRGATRGQTAYRVSRVHVARLLAARTEENIDA